MKVTNGDKLILKKLDACVSTSTDDINSKEFAVIIDHHHLVEEADPKSLKVLRDLLLFKRNATVKIFDHPVLITFIKRRWPKTWFYITFFVYWLYVMNFTMFCVAMFTPYDDHFYAAGHWLGLVCNDTEDLKLHFEVDNKTCGTGSSVRAAVKFSICDGADTELCGFEIIFFLCLLLLMAIEFFQAYALGIEYLRELENWLELSIIGLSIFCFSFKSNGRVLSVTASLALCLAWVQMLFLLGRFPTGGGIFNRSFINSSKRVLRVIVALLLLMVGFAFAFYILDSNQSSNEHSLLRFQVNSFIQVMGGADFEWLWDLSSNLQKYDEDTKYLPFRITAMTFLVTEILFGTVIFVNLIIAVIVIDMDYLHNLSVATAVRDQAHHAVQTRVRRGLFPCFSCLKDSPGEVKRAEEELVTHYCMHSVCECGREKLNDELSNTLLEIVEVDHEVKTI